METVQSNYKAKQLRWAMHKYKVDLMELQEVGVNWENFTTSNLLTSLLRQGSDPIRSVKSFNSLETKNIGDTQQGGTATIINDTLTMYVKDTGTDHTHLGQWSWYCLEGEPGHSTRVVTAYAPCGSNASGVSTYFKQAKRCIQNTNLNTTPKKMFREDLCAVLQQWRARGERIVLMMDANANVVDGVLSKMLAKDDIQLKEAVHSVTSVHGPKTHLRGRESINGIWFTPDLDLQSAAYLSFNADMGYHRPVMADFTQASLLGVNLPRIVQPAARRLNSQVARIQDKYIKKWGRSLNLARSRNV